MNRGNPEDVYKQVSEEIASGTYDQDLWEIALSDAGGDENIALVRYKLFRVRRLSGQEIPTEEKEAPQQPEEEQKHDSFSDPANEANPSEFPKSEAKKPIAMSKGSYIMTIFFYLILIFGFGYVNKTLDITQKIAQDRSMEIRKVGNIEYNNVRNEWTKLSKSKEYKRMSEQEKKKKLEHYDAKLLAARIKMSGGPEADQKMREDMHSQLRAAIATLFCLVGMWVSVFNLAKHLKMGCFTTVLLVGIPIIGWAGLLYVAYKNCQELEQ